MTQKRKLEDFEKISTIGRGSYGVVYKVRKRNTRDIVALKRVKLILNSNGCDEGIPSSSLREIAALKNLRHPNIVELHDVVQEENSLYLVFEHLDQDLKKALDLTKSGLPEKLARSYMQQLLKAIAYCHSKKILHRDLKLQNLLVNNHDGTIKLADFGLARSGVNPFRVYTNEVVTLWYRAPEILLGLSNYGPAVDMWSLGCIFYEMLTKKVLFPGDSEIGQLFKIFKILGTPDEEQWAGLTDLPHFKQTFPQWSPLDFKQLVPGHDEAMELLSEILIHDPDKRISAQDAMKHKYFDGLVKRITLRNIQDPSTLSPTKRHLFKSII